MHQRRSLRRDLSAKLEMTPMIDVVFLLLIFFIVTLRPADVLARLDVTRPAPSTEEPTIPLVTISVTRSGYFINGKTYPLEDLHRHLAKLASLSPYTALVISCADDAAHSRLVKLLDTCSVVGLTQIALVSPRNTE